MRKRGTLKVSEDGRLYTDESTLQSVCVKWFRTKYKYLEDLIFSIPNGARIGGKIGKKGFPVLASILKAEGMTEGIPDLMLALPLGGYAGLFIEMKTIAGSVSPEQRAKGKRLASVGYAVAKCETQNEFEKAVESYLEKKFVQVEFWVYKRVPKNVNPYLVG